LSSYSVGQTVGSETLTLTANNLAPHTHIVNTSPPSPTTSSGGGVPYNNIQPSLAVNFAVPLQGVFPSRGGGGGFSGPDPVLGFVYPTAAANQTSGSQSMLASGQVLSIAQHTAVFALVGTTYGGNGQTNFALPDLRGRAPIGTGQAPGFANRNLGGQYGSQTSTMTLGQMPNHDHTTPSIGGVTSFVGGSQTQDTVQPTLALNYVIAVEGIFPSNGGGGTINEPLLGQVNLFAGNFAPDGWMYCDGSLLSIAGNTALFSLLGTTYGGDGQSTFALPDLRDAIPVGAGQSAFSSWTLGELRGGDTITLTESQMPAHAHEFTSVPEPSMFVLGGIGLVGLLAYARRKKYRRA
jgi:microcystin-dependent protein